MKKTSWIMRLLLALPAILLLCLSAWIAVDRREQGGEKRVSVSAGEVLETAGSSSGTAPEEPPLTIRQEPAREPETGSRSGEETEPEDGPVGLLFAGDVYLSGHVTAAYDKAGGIHGVLDEGYREEISRADIFIANQEFPFGEGGEKAPDKEFTFRLPPERVCVLREAGIDLVTLANNHTLDYGPGVLSSTFQVLDQAGIRYVGAGEDLERAKKLETVEVKGKTIGFLAASHVFPDVSWAAGKGKPGVLSAYVPEVLLESTAEAKKHCDYLTVYVHWGKEKKEQPEGYQQDLARRLIDAGADLVVGSHPHVLQGIEYYKGKPIVYSLGNFIFGSAIPKTALLRVDLSQSGASLSIIPGTSGAGYTRKLTDEKKLQEFYEYMEGLSFGVEIDGEGNVSAP